MNVKPRQSWSEEQVKELVAQLLAGNKAVLPDLMDAHIEFTYKIASRWMKKSPHKYKDILSSAFQGMVQGITWAGEGKLYNENLQAYLAVTIRRFIRDFLEHDFLIPIPRKEFMKRMEEETVDDFMVRTLNHNPSVPTHRIALIQNIPVITFIDRDYESDDSEDCSMEIPSYDEYPHAMEDLYYKLELSPEQKVVVELKLQDYTNAEIGERMQCTGEWIRLMILEIRKKLVKIGLKPVLHEHKITGTKVCTRCDTERSLSDFHKRADSECGYKSICKICKKAEKNQCVLS